MNEAAQILRVEQQSTGTTLRTQFMDRLDAITPRLSEDQADMLLWTGDEAAALADSMYGQARDSIDQVVAERPEEQRRMAMHKSGLAEELKMTPEPHNRNSIPPLTDHAKLLGDKLGISEDDRADLANELVDAYIDYHRGAAHQATVEADTVAVPVSGEPSDKDKNAFADKQEAKIWARLLPKLEKVEQASTRQVASKLGRAVRDGLALPYKGRSASKGAKGYAVSDALYELEYELNRLEEQSSASTLRSAVYRRFPQLTLSNDFDTDSAYQKEFERIKQELQGKLTPAEILKGLEPVAIQFKEKIKAREAAKKVAELLAAQHASGGDPGQTWVKTPLPQVEENDPLRTEVGAAFDELSAEQNDKAAFRKLMKQYHPDSNPDDPQAKEKFNLVNNTYDAYLRAKTDEEKAKVVDELKDVS